MGKRYIKEIFQSCLLCGMFAWCVIDIAHAIAPPDPDVYDVGDGGIVPSTTTARVGTRAKIKAPRLPHYVTTSPRLTSTTGAAKPLIILIEFWGTPHISSHTATYFQNLVFSTTSLSLAGYYQENSGNAFHVTNATTTNPHDWLESGSRMIDYGRDGSDIDNYYGPIWRLAKEAVEKLALSELLWVKASHLSTI